ncbi:Hydra magnipapillata [Nesidiocoris tenuis]|nr:Hydra magnipapillata [Nesidiocoris tenuis]
MACITDRPDDGDIKSQEWRDAINDEFASMLKNKTWILCDRPSNRDTITSRLVLRTKYKKDGSIERRKARLVARGFNQRPGLDYDETYSPVIRLGTIRTMMALAAEKGMKVHQLDVVTAYLNGDIDKSIYMEIPEKLKESLTELVKSPDSLVKKEAKKMLQELSNGDKVCHLRKSLYGLKQSGRQWYKKLHHALVEMGFKPTPSDPCLYVKQKGKDMTLLGVYVDDLILTSTNEKLIVEIKKKLNEKFKTKDLGILNYCLGIEFECKEDYIKLSQKKYISDLLTKFKMENCKPVSTPQETRLKLNKPQTPDEKLPFRSLIGSLMYLAIATRPDIAHSVSFLSQFNQDHAEDHWKAAKRILRYLSGTKEVGLVYKKTGELLHGYSDSDWGNNIIDRHSYSGYLFKFGGAAISWEARKQRSVARSSVEAEYVERGLLSCVGVPQTTISIKSDSQGAIAWAENPCHHQRTKHIDIRYHYVREEIENGTLHLSYIPTESMPADSLTKSVPKEKHNFCRNFMGLSSSIAARSRDREGVLEVDPDSNVTTTIK